MSRKRRDIRYPWGLYAGAGGLAVLGGILLWPGILPFPIAGLGGLLLFIGLFLLILYGWPTSSYWGTFWRPDPISEFRGEGPRVDYPIFKWYERKNDTRHAIGVLSFFAGAFFLAAALMMYGGRHNLEETGTSILLDAIPPFIALSVALFIVTLATVLIPIRAPRSRP